MNNLHIYVTGHKHPDSDSICAAITYARLLNLQGKEAIACRQGPLNEESKFILKRFHTENPLLFTDARTKIKDIELDQPAFVQEDDTIHHAWHMMLKTQDRSLFVENEHKELTGICTTSDLATVRIRPDADLQDYMSRATVDQIARTIGGTVLVRPEHLEINGNVRIVTLDDEEIESYNLKGAICILTSSKGQEVCIDQGCKLLVITCGKELSDAIRKKAEEYHCAIIVTPQDSMHTARVINESYSVKEVMTKDVVTFSNEEFVDDAASEMQNKRARTYPVLDKKKNVVGAISLFHTRRYHRLQIALVDHSSYMQSIDNLRQAEVVSIIDHHQIGDIETDAPIEYRNHRCGCTCTIIYQLYQEQHQPIDKDTAGLLMSAILSDTLNLKSTTTKDEDRNAVKELAKIAGISDIDAYAREMLGASVSLKDASMHEILTRDLKYYEIGKYHIAIGQTNYSHLEEVQKILPAFAKNMEKEMKEKNLDLLTMLFTDVMGKGSYFVYYGSLSNVYNQILATQLNDHFGYDPNIISRKQQLVPILSELLKEMN